jgi:HSP20 family protein
MAKQRPSFFERLTGAVQADDYDFDDEKKSPERAPHHESAETSHSRDQIEQEAQLNVDVINAPDEIVIKALVAGVKPADLDISITREMVTIHGERFDKDMYANEDFVHQELFWGTFSRTIVLPEEIEVEEARASESNGLLVINLPKIDKKRETKLEVKSAVLQ